MKGSVTVPVAADERKPLTHSERGRLGAAKKWSNPAHRVVVRLDDLTTEQRAVVLALVNAAAKKAPAPLKADAQEVDRASDHTTAQRA